jgi:hypothetical protein
MIDNQWQIDFNRHIFLNHIRYDTILSSKGFLIFFIRTANSNPRIINTLQPCLIKTILWINTKETQSLVHYSKDKQKTAVDDISKSSKTIAVHIHHLLPPTPRRNQMKVSKDNPRNSSNHLNQLSRSDQPKVRR